MTGADCRDDEFAALQDRSVEMVFNGIIMLYVLFDRPPVSPYHGGVWKVRANSKGILIQTSINKTWSLWFVLVNTFEDSLPQLLLYPNLLYREAAA
ncbi:hypothetical protein SUGI_0224280 [Cryptomeria japonica]|nr:hypothetical protein SUGI_0224280 [Cryptomeria japonica]